MRIQSGENRGPSVSEIWTLKKSRQAEKEKSWCGAHELGQSDDEMERLSKMVGIL